MENSDPDLPLILALQGGDDSVLKSLIERHQESLFRFIYRYVQNEEVARDLLQESFVRLYFKRAQFKPRAKFKTWLFQLALNLCRDRVRSREYRQNHLTISLEPSHEGENTSKELASTQKNPGEALLKKEQMAALETAISELPHELKASLILMALEGKSQKECAELLNISPKAVEMRVYRAKKLIQEKLERAGKHLGHFS